jgi:hypothetical protein
MADTCVASIVTAIAALMDATGKPTGLTVTASRRRSTASDAALQHLAVYPVRDEPAPSYERRNRLFQGARRRLTVVVECRCAGTDLDNEALRAWAYDQVMADRSLGGLAVNVEEGTTEWGGELDSTADYSQSALELIVEYVRPRRTLESA